MIDNIIIHFIKKLKLIQYILKESIKIEIQQNVCGKIQSRYNRKGKRVYNTIELNFFYISYCFAEKENT